MEQNLELLRKLFFYFDEMRDAPLGELPRIDGYTEGVIEQHIRILHDVGFLHCEIDLTKSSSRLSGGRRYWLSLQGTRFLEAARNLSIWETTDYGRAA